MERRFNEVIVRALGNNRIGGTASVFYNGEPGTEFNVFDNAYERIHPGAFEQVLRSKPDVFALFNHDSNLPLGRTGAGNLKVWSDPQGLHYEIDLPDTSYARDLYKLVESGIVRGSSFGGNIAHAQWSKDGTKEVRTIHRFKQLLDVSPATRGAFGAANVGVLRSADIDHLKRERDLSLDTLYRIERAQQLK